MSLASLKTDESAKTEGVWFDYRGLKLRCRYTGPGNEGFQKAHRKAMKALHKEYRSGLASIPDEVYRARMIPVYARHVVTDWRGAKWTDDGPELECTPENVAKVLTEPGLEWIFPQVVQDAMNVDAYLTLEDDAKNSEAPSAGS